MLNILGLEIDFDITAPDDLLRYKKAGEDMEAAANNIPDVIQDNMSSEDFFDAYVDMLNRQLQLYCAFLDTVFGEGIAIKMLGNRPSLNKIADINDAISNAFAAQGKEYGLKLQKYQPNRAKRGGKR